MTHLERIYEIMVDGEPHTLDQLSVMTGIDTPTISARLRDLRKHGKVILRSHIDDKIYTYRMVVRGIANEQRGKDMRKYCHADKMSNEDKLIFMGLYKRYGIRPLISFMHIHLIEVHEEAGDWEVVAWYRDLIDQLGPIRNFIGDCP